MTHIRPGPGQEDFDWLTSLHWCRLLYDLLKSQGRPPVVVDGDDVVWRTQEMATNVCKAIGIGPSGVKETWTKTPPEDQIQNPIVQHALSTIYNSTGVERPAEKVRPSHRRLRDRSDHLSQPEEPLEFEREMQKIEKKYGKELASQFTTYIEKNMEDYDYLKQFKV